MKKAYVIFPAALLLVFFAFWWNFNSEYETRVAEKAAQARLEKEAKLRLEQKDREQAIKDAIVAQDQRKKEKAEKDARRAAEVAARQLEVDNRDKAFRDQDKLSRQVDRLAKELASEKATIAKLEEDKRKLIQEELAYQKYVQLAGGTGRDLAAVIERIVAADAARVAAAAAAEAARKKQ